MAVPLLNICIPTYNRASYIQACLDSITKQLADPRVAGKVHVTVLDNQSADTTRAVVESFTREYSDVRYICDTQKRPIAPGIIKAASLAEGEYVWIFSDDDVQKENCLVTIIAKLEASKPDVVITNFDSMNRDGVVSRCNRLAITSDIVCATRKQFLEFLNNTFYYTIDFYLTFCTNWILKRDVFKSGAETLKQFSGPLDVFPFQSIVLYGDQKFNTLVVADAVLNFREDNASWAKKNPLSTFWYSDALWRHHFGLIVKRNRALLPPGFATRVVIKNFLRYKDFAILLAAILLRKLGMYNWLRSLIKKLFSSKNAHV